MTAEEAPAIEHCAYIAKSPEVVFATLTTAAGWDSWFTNGTTLDARIGGLITLRWNDFGAGHYTTEDGGPIVEIEPNRRFAFQWSPGARPTTVDFTLRPLGEGTFLRLRERGYMSDEDELEVLVGCATGWGEAVTLLKFYLEYGITYGRVPQ
jgi:uncharacterized protein YndB with AHSA1/START domain